MSALPVIVDAASWLLILLGSFFTVVGGIGLVRMPEFYTRMHAASVTDTLGAGLLILGLMLQAGFGLVSLKLLFLLVLFFFLGPVVTHALAQAALHERDAPPSSEELAAAWRQYIEPCIATFGASRCMFESNFPPDKQTCGYTELWNAFKRITASASVDEKAAPYGSTAARTYRLTAP